MKKKLSPLSIIYSCLIFVFLYAPIAVLIIYSFKDLWNQGASMYIHSEQLKSLNYAIGQITAGGIKRAGASAAATVIMMLVPISVFVISQSNIIETMGSSGMKD